MRAGGERDGPVPRDLSWSPRLGWLPAAVIYDLKRGRRYATWAEFRFLAPACRQVGARRAAVGG